MVKPLLTMWTYSSKCICFNASICGLETKLTWLLKYASTTQVDYVLMYCRDEDQYEVGILIEIPLATLLAQKERLLGSAHLLGTPPPKCGVH